MIPSNMYPKVPPPVNTGDRGKRPTLLTDEVVKVLLANPNTWYVIGSRPKWISGVKHNIESMQQRNIQHLSDVGRFDVIQRKNKDTDMIDIYCQFVTNNEEE